MKKVSKFKRRVTNVEEIVRAMGENPAKVSRRGLPDVAKINSIKGLTAENPLRNLTVSQMLMLPKWYGGSHVVLWIEINKKLADLILDALNIINRPEKPRLQQDICADIRAGNFIVTSATLKFDKRGVFVDGQNRLRCVSATDTSQVFSVGFGEDPDVAVLYIDTGKARSASDMVKIMTGDGVKEQVTATAKHMYEDAFSWAGGRRMTPTEVAKACDLHWTFLMRSNSFFLNNAHAICATVKSVVTRAYYTQDVEKVDRFCQLATLQHLKWPPKAMHEHAVTAFVEVIRPLAGFRHEKKYKEIYRLTEMALANFINGVTPTAIKQATEELFPLPRTPLTASLEGKRELVKLQHKRATASSKTANVRERAT